MAKMTSDIGPTVAQLLGAEAPVNNIGVTIVDRGGPVKCSFRSEILNTPAATPIVVVGVAKNGVLMVGGSNTITMQTASRTSFQGMAFDPAAAVGDVYTLRASTTIPGALHQLTAGETQLLVEAVSQDAATCAGIGPATV